MNVQLEKANVNESYHTYECALEEADVKTDSYPQLEEANLNELYHTYECAARRGKFE